MKIISLNNPLTPVSFANIQITGNFWFDRQIVNRKNTIPASYIQLINTGRIDALKLQWKPGMTNMPHVFWDSDTAKWLETAADDLIINPDPKLAKIVDEVAKLIVSSQQPNGYINSHFTVVEPDKIFTNLRDQHELYCAGHLMEAAVAHYQATNDPFLLNALTRYADYIASVFGTEPGKKRGYCGHPEIELALMKIYDTTKQRKYFDLAKYFVDERGQDPLFFIEEAKLRGEKISSDFMAEIKKMVYYQAELPIREQDEIQGHAVRACYLYAGVTDVARESKDETLFMASKRLWEDCTLKKMYITGGIGTSRHNEGFTTAYDLPNDTAYCETCAAIALVFWSQRMLQIDCDSRYADIIERAIYNAILSGVSLDGNRFFYENPLEANLEKKTVERHDWFGCSCCPNNLSRLISTIGGYLYSLDDHSIYIHQFIQSKGEINYEKQSIQIVQETNYPWDGKVKIILNPQQPVNFTLKIRIPGWCQSFKLNLNAKPIEQGDVPIEKGYLAIKSQWKQGDFIEMVFNMPVERMYAHPKIIFDSGKVALQRGPLIYCLEGADNEEGLGEYILPQSSHLTAHFDPSLLGGVMIVEGKAIKRDPRDWENVAYRTQADSYHDVKLTAIPYYSWANRGKHEMIVWIREKPL